MNEEKPSSSRGFVILLTVLVAVFIIFFIVKFNDETPLDNSAGTISASTDQSGKAVLAAETEESTEEETQPTEPIDKLDLPEDDLYSSSVYLMDMSGNVLYDKNGSERIYPASLTKIMTAVVALENIDDLSEKVQIPGYIYDYIVSENASVAGFEAYDTVSLRDLLYGVLLESGAECCLTLTDYVAGTEYDFVCLMNDKAEELGMKNTHFTNSTGLHNYDHYSTAEDLAILLDYALGDYDFRKIFTSSEHFAVTDYFPEGITLESTVFSMADSYYDNFELLGGKTGFTDEAGLCLASLGKVDSEEYILITTGAQGSLNTEHYHIEDAETVYTAIHDELSGGDEYDYEEGSDDTDENE